jgi:hypothetical protein
MANIADLEFMKLQLAISIGIVGSQSTTFATYLDKEVISKIATKLGLNEIEEDNENYSFVSTMCQNLWRAFAFLSKDGQKIDVVGDTLDVMLYNIGTETSKDSSWAQLLAGRVPKLDIHTVASPLSSFLQTLNEYNVGSHTRAKGMLDSRVDFIESLEKGDMKKFAAQSLFTDLVFWVCLDD